MKKSELKDIIREEIYTFFESGKPISEDIDDDLTDEKKHEMEDIPGHAELMKKQNMRKFMGHMKDIGIMSPDGKLLKAGEYKAHFVNFKADPVEYIESFIELPWNG